MGEAIKTVYDKAVELAVITIEEPEKLPADELEFAVFQRAARYVPLLVCGGTVPSMLRYVSQSKREYVRICAVEERDGEEFVLYREPGDIDDETTSGGDDEVVAGEAGSEAAEEKEPADDDSLEAVAGDEDGEENEVEAKSEEKPEEDPDGEDDDEKKEESKAEEDQETREDADEKENPQVTAPSSPAAPVVPVVPRKAAPAMSQAKLPPDDTFLGITVRRILPDIVGRDALITIGTDTSFDVSDAFLADHKNCVVFAEQA